jgi:carbonic anhydrase
MDYSRRGFTSRLGLLVAGALAEDATAGPAAWPGASSPHVAQQDDHAHQPQPTPAAGSTENKFAVSEEAWEKLMAGNHRFVEGNPLRRDTVNRRTAVLAGQQPEVVVLGCSDSRTTPSLVFDQGLGDLFEIRTAGNVADALALGTIEYALEHLPIRVLVILGHEKCGAVAAAASGQKMKTANLQAIVDKIAPATAKVKGDPKSQEFLRAAEEANVLQCAIDLVANSSIVLRETAAKNVEIIKAVYSLQTGKVRRLTG